MSIKSIIIQNIVDLDVVIDSSILITGKSILQEQETLNNMWILSIDYCTAKRISVTHFIDFLSSLLQNKTKQLIQANISNSAIFYMWFDELAAQLRFNIISNVNQKLPFGCQIEIINSPNLILEEFLTSHYHSGISWNELKQLDNTMNHDDDEKPFILKVFVVHI
ncbi:MAG TPA: hypothetical protein VLB80_03820 [Candidatus Babeliales bacterium]|nr:hypothetical protein [Candidatus Babeliales bacterium]